MEIDNLLKYLELFSLSKNFTEKELKEAYRDLAHVWHPDKHNHNERLRKKAEKQIQKINEGFEFLKEILKSGYTSSSYSKPNSEKKTAKPNSQAQNPRPDYKPNGKNEKNEKKNRPSTPNKSTSSGFGCLIGGGIIFVVFMIVFVLSQSDDTNYSTESPSYETRQTKRKISNKLDEKNGFKSFQFSMSVAEAERIQKPTAKIEIKNIDNTVLSYEKNEYFNIGQYPISKVGLRFFKDKLYRIDIKISSYQSEIYQTVTHAFGQPYENELWTRGECSLRAKSWEGEAILCTILAEKNSLEETCWDTIIIYDMKINQEASEYEENEPIRASKDINIDGIGCVYLKMDIKDFLKLFKAVPNIIDSEFEQKTVFMRDPESIKIGFYTLDSIKGFFFKNKLYRIDVDFSEKRKELYQAFISRFPNSVKNDSWTKGKIKLTAMEFSHENNVALILSPKSKEPIWESLIFYSIDLTAERDKFEKEAPKRAANDI